MSDQPPLVDQLIDSVIDDCDRKLTSHSKRTKKLRDAIAEALARMVDLDQANADWAARDALLRQTLRDLAGGTP